MTDKHQQALPRCIGVIMDGNRRWARERGLPLLAGHERGYQVARDLGVWAKKHGVTSVILYGLSTENLQRSPEEVSYLMDLLRRLIKESSEEARKDNEDVRVSVIGLLDKLPRDIVEEIRKLEAQVPKNIRYHYTLALAYGGRAELVDAVNRLIKAGQPVSEDDISGALWTKDIPNPDLIIRTGGARRLSNFLPWQSTYSELLFLDKYWPDFTEEDFIFALKEFAARERRFGK